jgi:hypothetical protein
MFSMHTEIGFAYVDYEFSGPLGLQSKRTRISLPSRCWRAFVHTTLGICDVGWEIPAKPCVRRKPDSFSECLCARSDLSTFHSTSRYLTRGHFGTAPRSADCDCGPETLFLYLSTGSVRYALAQCRRKHASAAYRSPITLNMHPLLARRSS